MKVPEGRAWAVAQVRVAEGAPGRGGITEEEVSAGRGYREGLRAAHRDAPQGWV